jgi:metal-responsive CopG/Arc/MetJ family transcriptional regulator
MRTRGVKMQVTLTAELAEQVEQEIKVSYTTKSAWFTKVIMDFLEQKHKKEDGMRKKVIDLQIK